MQTRCKVCGKQIEIEAGVVPGQNIRCPFCDGKWAYAVNADFEITEKDLAYAIAECRKNETENRYYSAAPAGARLFIGLIFYGKIFKDSLDFGKYKAALTEIESELSTGDLDYLIQNETDPELINYFKGLRIMAKQVQADPDFAQRKTIVAQATLPKRPVLGVIRKAPENEQHSDLENEKEHSCGNGRQKTPAVMVRTLKTLESRLSGLVVELEKQKRRTVLVAAAIMTVSAVLIIGILLRATSSGHWKSRALYDANLRLEQMTLEYESATNELAATLRKLDERERRIADLRKEIKKAADNGNRPIEVAAADPEPSLSPDVLVEKLSSRMVGVWMQTDDESFPVGSSGKLYCGCLVSNGVFNLFSIAGIREGTSTTFTVSCLLQNGESMPIANEDFRRVVSEKGCLYVSEGIPLVRCSDNCLSRCYDLPEEGKTICPSELLLEGVADLLLRANCSTEKIEVDVRLLNRRGVSIPVTVCNVGDRIGMETFYDAVERSIIETKVVKSKGVGRKPRLTVRLWGGGVDCIRDGIQYVRTSYPDLFGANCIYARTDRSACPCLGCSRWRRHESDRKSWKRRYDEARRQVSALVAWHHEVKAFAEKKGIKANKDDVMKALGSASVKLSLNSKVVVSPLGADAGDSEGFGTSLPSVSFGSSDADTVKTKEAASEKRSPVDVEGGQRGVGGEDVGVPRLNKDGKLQGGYVKQLIAALRVKSFCGIDFGCVREGCTSCSGRGGELGKRFRMFNRYCAWGTDRFNRVARISLNGEMQNADEQNVLRELERVKDILDRKYSLNLNMKNKWVEGFSYEGETDDVKVVVTGTFQKGKHASLLLDFINKQVERQDAAIVEKLPRVDVSIPAGAGADVL